MIDAAPPTATPAQARKSTLVVAAIFALICGVQWYRGRLFAAEVTGALAALLFVVAVIPPAAMWFFGRWMALAAILGYVNTRILLSLFFYLIMTPVGVVLRLTGHDGLERRSKERKATYWHTREHTKQSREGFERAF